MARTAKRATYAPRLEVLEIRALLSADTGTELFVRFKAGAPQSSVDTALSTLKATVVESFPDGPSVIALGAGVDATRALQWLQADPYVLYAENDGTIQQTDVTPNNPNYNQQYGLTQIDAPAAWSVTQGSSSVIVAVLDTGLDLSNPAFAGRLWVNPTAGQDGYSGDVNGWNFVSNNSNVQDNDGHGTHVTGILAATGNNGIGVAGVDWNARIMVVKVLDSAGNGSTSNAIAGIYFAAQHGARVINASWGGGTYSAALADAIAYAGSLGAVFVTAAGNDGVNSDVKPSYPGSYNLPNEIVVAAVDSSGNLASFSDYGSSSVTLAAPGVNILSTVPGGFGTLSGTSMATPYVSGVVSLVVGLHPEWTAIQVVQHIKSTVKADPALAGKTSTGGIVDAANAVRAAAATPSSGNSAASQEATPYQAFLVHIAQSSRKAARFRRHAPLPRHRFPRRARFPRRFIQRHEVANLAVHHPDPTLVRAASHQPMEGRQFVGGSRNASADHPFLALLESGMSRSDIAHHIRATLDTKRALVTHWAFNRRGGA